MTKGEEYMQKWLTHSRRNKLEIYYPELINEMLNIKPSTIMQINWSPQTVNLGHLKVNQRTLLTFQYIGNTPEQINPQGISASCGCTKPKWNAETKTLEVVYTPNPIPAHLKLQGQNSYHSEKYILINYGMTIDKLIFTAEISE